MFQGDRRARLNAPLDQGMAKLSVAVRAADYEFGGQEFESLRARHNLNVFQKILVIS